VRACPNESQSHFWRFWNDLPAKLKAGYDPAMSTLLPALAVTFAAFCVWLVVRIANHRERWAKRATVGLVASLPLLYVASVGPACWLADNYQRWNDLASLRRAYWPLRKTLACTPKPVGDAVWWWAGLGCRYTVWDYVALAQSRNDHL